MKMTNNETDANLQDTEQWLGYARIVNISTIVAPIAWFVVANITNIMVSSSMQFLVYVIYMIVTIVIAVFAVVCAVKLNGTGVKGVTLMIVSSVILAVLGVLGVSIGIINIILSAFSLRRMKESKEEMVLREKLRNQKGTEEIVIVETTNATEILPDIIVASAEGEEE